ncbi:MAG: hypothetical protein ACHRHE_16365, partial [Tepidisphaerales bacterium]
SVQYTTELQTRLASHAVHHFKRVTIAVILFPKRGCGRIRIAGGFQLLNTVQFELPCLTPFLDA